MAAAAAAAGAHVICAQAERTVVDVVVSLPAFRSAAYRSEMGVDPKTGKQVCVGVTQVSA